MSNQPLYSEFADDEDMAELLVEFVEGLHTTCEKLQSALATEDKDTVRRIGHQLKGAGGGYGFPLITELGAKLESAVQAEGKINDVVSERAFELIAACRRARSTPE